jgi:hypothetical protein
MWPHVRDKIPLLDNDDSRVNGYYSKPEIFMILSKPCMAIKGKRNSGGMVLTA